MKFERLRCEKLTGVGTEDWVFSEGSILVLCLKRSLHKPLREHLQALFYDGEKPEDGTGEGVEGLLEVWLADDNSRFYFRREFGRGKTELKIFSMQEPEQKQETGSGIGADAGTDAGTGRRKGQEQRHVPGQDMESGEAVFWPEDVDLGEFLFELNARSFSRGVLIDWPGRIELLRLNRLLDNLRTSGEEKLSTAKVRASLAVAQKKISDQRSSMLQVKEDFDALREEWEAAERQLEMERLWLIEIQNFQEKEALLEGRLEAAKVLQERIDVLRENLDYRELRRIRDELAQLEEQLSIAEKELQKVTSDASLDWSVLDDLREECIIWVEVQERVDQLKAKIERRMQAITEVQDYLQESGYDDLPPHEDQNLRKADAKKSKAQKELSLIQGFRLELEAAQSDQDGALVRLRDFEDLETVTERIERKYQRRESFLENWRNSRFGGFLDKRLEKYFFGISVGGKLSARYAKYYHKYQAENYEEFAARLNAWRELKARIERLQKKRQDLQSKIDREESLQITVRTLTERLEQAFEAVGVSDLTGWIHGWLEYLRKKQELTQVIEELQNFLDEKPEAEETLRDYAAQMAEKLAGWQDSVTDRESVLALVFQAAAKLREKDSAEKAVLACAEHFNDLLGDRDLKSLEEKLEPLADLERENLISDEERQAERDGWENERTAIQEQCGEVEDRLKNKKVYPPLNVLEKEIETKKQQWTNYVELESALDDAKKLLEAAWQEWQAKPGKELEREMAFILGNICAYLSIETNPVPAKAKRDYFTYYIAVSQLTFRQRTEMPLLFFIEEDDTRIDEFFWLDVMEYFRKMSLDRQIVILTEDPEWGRNLPKALDLHFL